MTLEEAIIHCEEVANDRAGCCEDCAEEHRQLAEWLKELREIKNIVDSAEMIIEEQYGVVIVEGYADVFDLIKKKVRLWEQ